MLCPFCGYDLRASTSDRCSECGKVVDRDALNVSAIPWAHRRSIGRLRAYWRTVNQITFDRRKLRDELSRPQDDRDASLFRRWTAFGLFIVAVTFVLVVIGAGGWSEIVPVQSTSFSFGTTVRGEWLQDALVPWFSGVTCLPCLPLYLAGMAFYVTGVGRSLYRLGGYPAEHQQAAQAMSIYASAPIALLIPAGLLVLLGALAFDWSDRYQDSSGRRLGYLNAVPVTFAILAFVLTVIALLGGLHRSGQWVARAYHAGLTRAAMAVLELLGRTAVGGLMFLYVAPWCVGLWRIMIFAE